MVKPGDNIPIYMREQIIENIKDERRTLRVSENNIITFINNSIICFVEKFMQIKFQSVETFLSEQALVRTSKPKHQNLLYERRD